jgi:hypothetical protein
VVKKKSRAGWSIKYLTLPFFLTSTFDVKVGITLFSYIDSKKPNYNSSEYDSFLRDFLKEFSLSYSNEFLVKFFEYTVKFLEDSKNYYDSL